MPMHIPSKPMGFFEKHISPTIKGPIMLGCKKAVVTKSQQCPGVVQMLEKRKGEPEVLILNYISSDYSHPF